MTKRQTTVQFFAGLVMINVMSGLLLLGNILSRWYPAFRGPVVTLLMYLAVLVPYAFLLFGERLVWRQRILSYGFRPALPEQKIRSSFLMGLLLMVVTIAPGAAVLGVSAAVQPLFRLDLSGLAQNVPLYLIMAFCEEAVCRGYLQTVLRKQATVRAAIVVAALLFAVLHFPSELYLLWAKSPALMLGTLAIQFIGGLFFGWLTHRDGCIYGAWLAHFGMNVCSMLIQSVLP
ncbi:MAG: CPBP family intramembrane metalloprotease [Oscillospiraceae bacterium]|jgi:membrane protease YdiL (CAAX protease family)|nr:CPBP family intramembrane metalloprotease [Oscillospiraceae bacterium]